jgi:hypothetical protein
MTDRPPIVIDLRKIADAQRIEALLIEALKRKEADRAGR